MKRLVEGIELDLDGLQILPGLINAHDHLEFALFPRLGQRHYANATEWARDIYHPDQSPVREHLQIPKSLRLQWGGLRNLACGVTTVCHHNPYEAVFDDDFPVRVVKSYGWAHSLAFEANIRDRFDATPPGAPFLIHAGEGTDEDAAAEIFKLDELGVLDERTVLIHAVGFRSDGWKLTRKIGAGVVWCPRSNLFTLGRTLSQDVIASGIPMALGTDSPLTAEGDLLDEIRAARELVGEYSFDAARILRLSPQPDDWIAAPEFGEPPELVVVGDRIRLIGPRLARALPTRICREFYPLKMETRLPVLVRWNVPRMLEEAAQHLGEDVRLARRRVCA
ncbi:MAG: amidohydrolase [Bryobacterales bacterium]|nr:amidohydrolase [Bryobacterales bacterium]